MLAFEPFEPQRRRSCFTARQRLPSADADDFQFDQMENRRAKRAGR
jgi:hypothetical protein